MIRRKNYSQAVADLLPDSGGWVHSSKRTSPAEAASALLRGLVEMFGSEAKARAVLADIPEAAVIVALLPARKRGRPATATQRQKDEAIFQVFTLLAAQGRSVRAIARRLHKGGMGASAESVERKLHSLKARFRRP